ncbi:hypothetical protein GALMADRAFT_487606 [Galerina marginata CBS 339.88]|uniref:Uncharacterized protein n=1 Tax=Galerina marginata (strain CBS 339.88) TaxID=685588 RepID=A0A067SZT0_GALM3|nr:hypothetical protein GALMADRAFT_487606 [Galerina marginata CBS 339.88]
MRISMPSFLFFFVSSAAFTASLPVLYLQSLLALVLPSRDILKYILKLSPSSYVQMWMEDVWLRDPTSSTHLPLCVGIALHSLGWIFLGYWLWHFYNFSLLLPFLFSKLLYICLLWFVSLYCPLASLNNFILLLFPLHSRSIWWTLDLSLTTVHSLRLAHSLHSLLRRLPNIPCELADNPCMPSSTHHRTASAKSHIICTLKCSPQYSLPPPSLYSSASVSSVGLHICIPTCGTL